MIMSDLSFKLEAFEGPLDLLLNLISKNKIDIYDIPIAVILEQYLAYLEEMRKMDMDIAGEFITMAAELMVIKSRMMLPKSVLENEEDPRARLHLLNISEQKTPQFFWHQITNSLQAVLPNRPMKPRMSRYPSFSIRIRSCSKKRLYA